MSQTRSVVPVRCLRGTIFLGDHPNDDYGWTDNVQGVAHDASNWFFTTQEGAVVGDSDLIKLPVGFDLATEFDPEDPDTWPSGGLRVPMPSVLDDGGYDQFKDLDQAQGFLFVPVNGNDPDTDVGIAGIAVFHRRCAACLQRCGGFSSQGRDRSDQPPPRQHAGCGVHSMGGSVSGERALRRAVDRRIDQWLRHLQLRVRPETTCISSTTRSKSPSRPESSSPWQSRR